MTIEKTLQERGSRYGTFSEHARVAQEIQDVFRKEPGWNALAPDQKQALTVIADKVARMLHGDPNYRDNWHDIVGYAKLVDDRMAADEAAPVDQVDNSDEALRARLLEDAMSGEWVQHDGGKRPVPPEVMVEYQVDTGDRFRGKASGLYWASGRIVAYRAVPAHG